MNTLKARTSISPQLKSTLANAFRVSPIVTDPVQMDLNIRAKLTRGEFIAVLLGLATIGIAIWLYQLGLYVPIDYTYFTTSASGDLNYYFYGFWIMPVFNLLRLLPYPVGYSVWGILNLAGVWFAARVISGKATWALLVYQLFYMLYYGQISGFIAGGLGIAWYGLAHRKWDLAGLGFLIAGAKPQTGLMAGGLLWLLAPLTWKERFRILFVPVLGVVLSLLIYPGWPLQVLQEWERIQPNDFASITLWRWIGPVGLLLFVPPLFLPLPWHRRFIALVCTATLALPYFQQADLLVLYVLPVGAFAALGNLGFLYPWFQWDALKIIGVVPLTIYLVIVSPASAAWLRNKNPGSMG